MKSISQLQFNKICIYNHICIQFYLVLNILKMNTSVIRFSFHWSIYNNKKKITTVDEIKDVRSNC